MMKAVHSVALVNRSMCCTDNHETGQRTGPVAARSLQRHIVCAFARGFHRTSVGVADDIASRARRQRGGAELNMTLTEGPSSRDYRMALDRRHAKGFVGGG